MAGTRAMNLRLCTLLFGVLVAAACGEAEVIELPTRPDRASFEEMQKTLITIGCSAGGSCHAVLVGNFKVADFPKAPGVSETEYILTKPFLDLNAAEQSVLIRTAVRDDPLALGHAICFENLESCSARRIIAWINYAGEGDETMDEACPPDEMIENACFNL